MPEDVMRGEFDRMFYGVSLYDAAGNHVPGSLVRYDFATRQYVAVGAKCGPRIVYSRDEPPPPRGPNRRERRSARTRSR